MTEVLQMLHGGRIPRSTENHWAIGFCGWTGGPVLLRRLLFWRHHPHLGASGANTWDGHFEVTRWVVLMWDGNYFCDSNTGLHLGRSLVIRLTNIHALLHKWLLTLAVIVEAHTHAHIDKGKWDWPCCYGSSQWASQWDCWSTPICHPLHLLTLFIPLFGNICKTDFSPFSPHRS